MGFQKCRFLVIGLFAFVLTTWESARAQDTPTETIKAVRDQAEAQLRSIQAEIDDELKRATDDDAREQLSMSSTVKAFEVLRPAGEKVLELIRPTAADASSINDLLWVVTSARGSNASDVAAGLLMEFHPLDRRTIELSYRHKGAPLSWVRPMLSAQLANGALESKDSARLLLALATQTQTLSEIPAVMNEMSDRELQVWEATYSADWMTSLRKLDCAKNEAESIRLYEELRERFGPIKAIRDIDYDKLATSAIFAIQNLSVGKVAPDIIGEDLDGVGFKLSDYRGKVVLLSFWGEWCGPCMALIPHEKELHSRLDRKPFVLIGVNSDTDKNKVQELQIPWRSFWCGEKGPLGEIPMAWSIRGWPQMYVLDEQGIIRAKHTTGQRIDEIIDQLVQNIQR